jgi:nicotinamide phosphoribosyltransferase
LLWDIFGGTINEQGYKVLDPHIGAIYGDSITIDRAEEICKRLEAKGFASTNIVLGIGSFTYQYNTRDTFGFAMKATYVELTRRGINPATGKEIVVVEPREIFKDPITDDGTKKSAKGLLCVDEEQGEFFLRDGISWKLEQGGLLKTIFKDGELINSITLTEIRERLNKSG